MDKLYTARWAITEALENGRMELLDTAWDMIAQAKADHITQDVLKDIEDVKETLDEISKQKPKDELPDLSEKKQIAVAMIVGHTRAAGGAVAAAPISMNEYTYWSREMYAHQEAFSELGIVSKVFYRDNIGIAGAYREAKKWLNAHVNMVQVLIEYHFNAFNKKAFGTETLHSNKRDARGVQERVFAQMIQDAMVKTYNRTGRGNRGLKNLATPGESGFYNLVQVVDRPSILIEPFFGDNPSEAALAKKHERDLPRNIALAVKNFGEIA